MALVSDVLTEARILLNDASGSRYSDASLLPIFKKVYLDLQRRMVRAGLPLSRERSSGINVATPATVVTSPADLIVPISLEESDTTGQQWTDMERKQWEDIRVTPGEKFDNWAWRENEIKVPSCSANRLVRIYYIKSLPAITAVGDTVAIPLAEQYLASSVAAVAAFVIGANPSRAEALNTDAENNWEEFVGYHTKSEQGVRVRRKGFRRPRWI